MHPKEVHTFLHRTINVMTQLIKYWSFFKNLLQICCLIDEISVVFYFKFKQIRRISCLCVDMLGSVSLKKEAEDEKEEVNSPPVRIIPLPVQPGIPSNCPKPNMTVKVMHSSCNDITNHFCSFESIISFVE